jgi:4-coumarate--CoA ligase
MKLTANISSCVPLIFSKFLHFAQGYGMTESTAVGTRGFNTSKHKKFASVGLLAPNTHAKIVDLETGFCLPPGSCGELWLHGPAVMKGSIS